MERFFACQGILFSILKRNCDLLALRVVAQNRGLAWGWLAQRFQGFASLKNAHEHAHRLGFQWPPLNERGDRNPAPILLGDQQDKSSEALRN
jgi:hypothetical protein